MINLYLYEDGLDLIMEARGSYDLTALTPTGPSNALSSTAVAMPGFFHTYGWETGATDVYALTTVSNLTGSGFVLDAGSASANLPFYIQDSSLYIPTGSSKTASGINNIATFSDTSFADLGMVADETATLTWSGDSMVLHTSAPVPEPSAYAALLGAVGLMIALGKRFK